jgi:hypothetical protein
MRLLWLPDVLTDAGLELHIEPGWETRGRESWGPVKAIMVHHTATPASAPGDYPSMRIVRDGRLPPDPSPVPGPLSQLGLGRSGKVYVIASGRANHAGSGSHSEFTGSSQSIGIEAEHPGGRAPWSAEQYEAYVHLCAVLADHLDIPTRLVIGHKEWAPARKVDPNFDMDVFRGRIETRRSGMDPELVEFVKWLKKEVESSSNPVFDGSVDKAKARGVFTKYTEDEAPITAAKLATFLDRAGVLDPVSGGTVDNLARSEIAKLRNHLRQS